MEKPIHTVVLDAGPIIRGQPSVSSLLQRCEKIVSIPAVISEIRDENTRSRLHATLMPFLDLRSPKPESVRFVSEFARKTGDLSVLSSTDMQIIALAYDLECERNGGDWRLRKAPGQKRTNAPMPLKQKQEEQMEEDNQPHIQASVNGSPVDAVSVPSSNHSSGSQASLSEEASQSTQIPLISTVGSEDHPSGTRMDAEEGVTLGQSEEQREDSFTPHDDESLENPGPVDDLAEQLATTKISEHSTSEEPSDDSDSEGWITPSNIKKVQAADETSVSSGLEQKVLQVATITTDFAMQNVLLQMNLNLISPSLQRVRHIRTYVLRCYACFQVVKDTSKQFCPRCGKPTLTRVSCSTNAQGEFKMHFKKNMQWNKRGDRYSIPKPVAGSANGRASGGGKDGWGSKLILAEDQKEYVRAVDQEKRLKARDLMDEDYLPSILSGNRSQAGGRPKIGAGRNVNSRKRK